MSDILFVSSQPIPMEFAQLCRRAGYAVTDWAKSGNEARRLYRARNYAVVVVNTPLIDELGDRVALDAFMSTTSNSIVIAKPDIANSLEEKMDFNGVVIVTRPVSLRAIYRVLTLFKAQERRLAVLTDQNRKLQEKVEEIKLVSRAKMLLMEKLHMSEDEAHRHLDKTSKDQRRTKKDVAESIINMYL